eukprot:Lankesteria_metandrocarpae@DN3619_c0_g1_i1.p1
MLPWNGKAPLIQIAPMMDVTDRNFRAFVRLLSRRAELWTEMVVDGTLIHTQSLGDFLGHDELERPLVCQIGGCCPDKMAAAAEIVCNWHTKFDSININVGCPSSKVAGRGKFGATLMKEAEAVRDIVHSVKRKVDIPVSVKTRIGVDDKDDFGFLANFVETVSAAGVEHFIIHARKALLDGIKPTQNRSVPPLNYGRVYELCDAFPHLKFTLNGGVTNLAMAEKLLYGKWSDGNVRTDALMRRITQEGRRRPLFGIMIGRAALNNPCLLGEVDTKIYGEVVNPETCKTRRSILENYMKHIDLVNESKEDSHLKSPFQQLRPIFGVFHGTHGNRKFRQTLDDLTRTWVKHHKRGLLSSVISDALTVFTEDLQDIPDRRITEKTDSSTVSSG